MSNPYILVLYYSRTQGTQNLALQIARGVDRVAGIEARIRTVPPVSAVSERTAASVPDDGAIFCSKDDLVNCSGLALGSATRFGNMAAPLKYFLDTTADLWASHQLVGKPASVFCSTGSLHGGQETTLLTMMVPLLHHGMLIQGLPYSVPELNHTQSGGTPYGVTHVQGQNDAGALSAAETAMAQSAGQQLAETALRLKLSEKN
jgi:NAD(P)H dehydrogenase (quinone)